MENFSIDVYSALYICPARYSVYCADAWAEAHLKLAERKTK